MEIKFIRTVTFVVLSFILLGTAHVKGKMHLKKLYYENSSGEKGITTFYYSQDHKNYKAKWELLDGSRYSINYHFLDSNENIIRKYREFSDSISSNVFYKYDVNNNLVEEYFERSDNVKGITWYRYNEVGNRIEAECRGLNGWFYGFIRYEYTNGKITKGIILNKGNKIGYIEYNYDEKGNLIKEYWDFGGKWTQTFTYEYANIENKLPESYTYSSPFLKETKKFIVNKENYSWNGGSKGPSFYKYEGNKLIQKIYEFENIKTTTTYKYDNDGLLMKSFRSYTDGSKAEFSYHFNEKRQLVHRLFNGDDGFTGSETYEYDEAGRLLKAEWDGFDKWLTGTITFQYDENNALKSAFFKGKNNFDANIEFETDSENNITKIYWDFTFGKTQTYWFEYKNL